MRNYTLKDLEYWTEKIEAKTREFELDCHAQEFELCDYRDMIGYMTYQGLPAYYPHWSFGKLFEKIQIFSSYGFIGLPYELVINSNPCLAYLLRENSLAVQLITIAHAGSGHNDFFKNNVEFSHTQPEYILTKIKLWGDRIREYERKFGEKPVKRIIDAAHALSLHRIYDFKDKDANNSSNKANILLYLRDYNPRLEDWEREILTIVDELAKYFIPQIKTKIINEGWATYWHYQILKALDLPQELEFEFLTEHHKIIDVPENYLEIHPYALGFGILEDIKESRGEEALFSARRNDDDISFLKEHLTEKIAKKLNLFQYETLQELKKITKITVPDWEEIKKTLIRNIGMNRIPLIKIVNDKYGKNNCLFLKHYYDGRELEPEFTRGTLAHFQYMWRASVIFETIENHKFVRYQCRDSGKISRFEVEAKSQMPLFEDKQD